MPSKIKVGILTLRIKEKYNSPRRTEILDLGGGLGIPYENDKTPSPEELISIIEQELEDADMRFEDASLELMEEHWQTAKAAILKIK